MNKQTSQPSGYTLIELLVVTALLGMLLLGVSTLFMQSLFASIRTSQRQELRAEGQFGLDVLNYIIRNARAVQPCGDSPATPFETDTLVIGGADGVDTTFSLVGPNALGNFQIASSSANAVDARITSDSIHISSPNGNLFTCATNANQQPYVIIRFTASKDNQLGAPLTQSFRQVVLIRNKILQ